VRQGDVVRLVGSESDWAGCADWARCESDWRDASHTGRDMSQTGGM
jgi:hypothetical protein